MHETELEGIKGDILIVDDDAPSLQTLSSILLEQGYGVRRARDAQTAWMIINNSPPDLILLDVRMPKMNGFEFCQKLKANKGISEIPVLFLSALDETEDKISAFKVGGVDYITKPFQVEEVLARVQTHLDLYGLRYQLERKNVNLKNAIKEQKNTQSALEKLNNELEQRVIARTAKLNKTNIDLKSQIDERKRIEENLKVSKDRLDAEIKERKQREVELRQAQKELTQQLVFEELISRLSAEFINLPYNQINKKINHCFSLIAKNLGIDRIALLQFSQDLSEFYLTHTYAVNSQHNAPKFLVSEQLPWFTGSLCQGKTLRISSISEIPEEAVAEKQYAKDQGFKSFLTIPMKIDKRVIGAISYSNMTSAQAWPDEIVNRFTLVNRVFANALDRKQNDKNLQNALFEIEQLKNQLENENIQLRQEIKLKYKHNEIVGRSEGIKHVLSQAEKVAAQNTCVLITGETGTGKELVAQAIHNLSPLRNHVMIKVNCAALPASLIESEMFGREKGAYTGALTRQMGRFEAAHRSTIFLDEIGDLPPEIQVKLLRVLQEGKFERLGSTKTIEADVRIIAATNKDLSTAVKSGTFRNDLYYRLHVFPIVIPPLRQRRDDIPLLTWSFVREFENAMGKKIETISKYAMQKLQTYSWPGNVRELKNVVERAVILCDGSDLKIINIESEASPMPDVTLEEVTRKHIVKTLENTRWRVGGKNGAAEILGLKRTTLLTKMNKLNIKRPTSRNEKGFRFI